MMIAIKSIALAASLVASVPAFSLAEDAHHPGAGTSPSAAATPAQKDQAGGMSMMPMMGMMMSMMGKGMPDMPMPGMDMGDRVEGRLAFLRAELKIAQAQTKSWDAFAQALRENGGRVAEMRPMMGMAQQANAQPMGLVQRLEHQEHWYAVRLSGIQAIRASFAALYAALSDEQKKTADELMAPHLGLMPMGMPFN